MRPDVYENNGEGILCVYKNEKWLVSIKNWKPDNDNDGIAHLSLIHILAQPLKRMVFLTSGWMKNGSVILWKLSKRSAGNHKEM